LSTRLIFALFLGSTAALASEPDSARQKQLVHLVRQDCGSCHGMTLNGGLGPALLPETLKDKPPAGLAATIYYGRPGTPMPPWKQFISEDEAAWIVQELMTGFPQ
jgi:cytochrome c55X